VAIVFVASVSFGGGERLARALADKLGYPFFSRDDLVARANELGIPVGKLELAMVKKPAVAERLARLREQYLAVATARMCEVAKEGNLVYLGRTGHMLLPGVSHVVRVRVVPQSEQRLENAMQRTKLSREKAERMLADIDIDVRSWVRFVHGVDFDDLARYDLVVNLEHLSLTNAAIALCNLVELPDFQPTPASRRAMQELDLQAQARLRLTLDPRTAEADLTVRASGGVVTVTYVPGQAEVAPLIPDVLRQLEGCREVRCTLASSTILWIEERFDPSSPALADICELARRWGAAVELLGFRPGAPSLPAVVSEPPRSRPAPGGVEEDVVEVVSAAEDGLRQTVGVLVRDGLSGGGSQVAGDRDDLIGAIRSSSRFSLIAIGGVFMDKAPAARTRMTRELSAFIGKRVKAPVLGTGELGEKIHFGPLQVLRLGVAALATVVVYLAIFHFQGPLVDLLGGAQHKRLPWAAPAVVAVVAPLIAWLYGAVAASLLKLIRLE
jgi:cytidylate kinase